MGRPAARITDPVAHPLPPVLTPGPGSLNVFIGGLPAWRGVSAAAAAAIQSAKAVSDAAIKTAEAATLAAAGTPGLPAVEALSQQQLVFIEGMQSLEILEAFTEKSDGRRISVDPSKIITRDAGSVMQATYLPDLKQRILFPGCRRWGYLGDENCE